jgi:hypothetical protein
MRTLLSAALTASLLLSPVAEANNYVHGAAWHGGGWRGGGWRGGPGWRGAPWHPGYRWGFYRGYWGWWAPALFGLAVGAAIAAPYYYAQPYPYYYAPPRQCWSGWAWYPC